MTYILKEFKEDAILNLPQDIDIFIRQNNVLAVSNSKASFIVFPVFMLNCFQALSKKKSIKSSLDVLQKDIFDNRLFHLDANNELKRLLSYIILQNFFYDVKVNEQLLALQSLHFYITNQCNLRCTTCYMDAGIKSKNELTTDEILKSINIFSKMYPNAEITISGGEPLIHPDIKTILMYSKDCGLTVNLYTNGLLLNKTNFNSILSSLDFIQVSLDGATDAVNDKIRGRNTFNKIINTIKLIDNYNSNNRTVLLRIGVVLTNENHEDIKNNLPMLLEKLKLKNKIEVAIGMVSFLGRAKNCSNISKYRDELLDIRYDILNYFAELGLFSGFQENRNTKATNCGFGSAITISSDGYVYPCQLLSQPSLGNICNNNLEELFLKATNLQKETSLDNIEKCKHCNISSFCTGTCRIQNYKVTGNYSNTICDESHQEFIIQQMISTFPSLLCTFGLE